MLQKFIQLNVIQIMTFRRMTFERMAFRRKTFRKMTFRRMTFKRMAFSRVTFSRMPLTEWDSAYYQILCLLQSDFYISYNVLLSVVLLKFVLIGCCGTNRKVRI